MLKIEVLHLTQKSCVQTRFILTLSVSTAQNCCCVLNYILYVKDIVNLFCVLVLLLLLNYFFKIFGHLMEIWLDSPLCVLIFGCNLNQNVLFLSMIFIIGGHVFFKVVDFLLRFLS
jgi:hypothetical protein